MRATTRPVIKEVHLTLDENDLWELLYSCTADWRSLIGVHDEKWTLKVTHVDKGLRDIPPNRSDDQYGRQVYPDAAVRICMSLQEKPLNQIKEKEQKA